MKKTEARRKFEELEIEMELENRASNMNRARSVTVGTAFGGTTEIMMRSDGGRHIWCVMQPVEVIELIHQLAANVGCHLALKPREDFATWRDWKLTDQEKLHYNGFAPFPNDLISHAETGANMAKYEAQQITTKDPALLSAGKIEKTKNKIKQEVLSGAPSVELDPDGVLLNTVIQKEDGTITVLGGAGGNTTERKNQIRKKYKKV